MGDSTKTLHTIALVTPSMSSAALVLLEHAQFIRASAARTRQLANETTMPEVAEQLIRFAAELEHRALELEKRAASIAKTVARTRKRSSAQRQSRLVTSRTEPLPSGEEACLRARPCRILRTVIGE